MTPYIHPLRLLAAGAMLLWGLASCINEGLEECPAEYSVRFRYDYNMAFIDQFADEVDNLSLYVFDENGKYLRTFTDRGEALRKPGYRLPLPLEPGRYRFFFWAGLEENAFEVPSLRAAASSPEELAVTLKRGENGEVPHDKPLRPLWHAMAETVVVPPPGVSVTDTLDLIKVTNTIRVILRQRNGTELQAADFNVRIDCPEGNGRMACNNTLLSDEPLVYRPYSQEKTTDDDPEADAASGSQPGVASGVTAELSVARLMEKDPMRLRIAKGGNTLIDVPLISYLMLTQREQDKRIFSDQEYLDWQDEYTITFFLDGESWFDGLIIINGWALRPGSIDL
ncbi:MAG: FimB/Mfa2 family fimbrial subunit [Parabacteroides sp.]|nr:FimB/Mfa2 family fimbrial subunit [Parabacteroides sp.]